VAKQDHSYQAIERALRAGASASAGADAGALCVDGETLAAWSSGTLAKADAARVEEHLADCARCQSMVAAFARTEPLVEAPASWLARRSFSVGGRRAQIRWLVPLATAATVAAIWVATPQRNEPAPPSLADSRAPVETERFAAPSQTAPTQAAPSQAAPSQPAPRLQAPSAPPSARAETASAAAKRVAPMREADAVQQRKEEDSRARREAGATASQRPPRDSLARDERPAGPPAAAPLATPAPTEGPIAPETRQLLAKTAADFASPDGAARWRIVAGQVQRSTAQGRIWDVVTLPSPATITAGHAPTASVAWLVGRAGAIFVTTDGTRFERVPFPQSVDIVSILAIDGRQATVTTVDGRVFGTSDRGVSWISP
jgi:hypothetical protein